MTRLVQRQQSFGSTLSFFFVEPIHGWSTRRIQFFFNFERMLYWYEMKAFIFKNLFLSYFILSFLIPLFYWTEIHLWINNYEDYCGRRSNMIRKCDLMQECWCWWMKPGYDCFQNVVIHGITLCHTLPYLMWYLTLLYFTSYLTLPYA